MSFEMFPWKSFQAFLRVPALEDILLVSWQNSLKIIRERRRRCLCVFKLMHQWLMSLHSAVLGVWPLSVSCCAVHLWLSWLLSYTVGMHDVRFYADIRYVNNLQLIWPIINIDTGIDVYFFPTPNCRDHQVSSMVEFTWSIIMHTYIVLASKCKHIIQSLKWWNIHFLWKKKNTWIYVMQNTTYLFMTIAWPISNI